MKWEGKALWVHINRSLVDIFELKGLKLFVALIRMQLEPNETSKQNLTT